MFTIKIDLFLANRLLFVSCACLLIDLFNLYSFFIFFVKHVLINQAIPLELNTLEGYAASTLLL